MAMFNVSEQAANLVYVIFNIILVLGAVLALVGTIGVFWSGGIREHFADLKISKNIAETSVAKADAANANARASEADLKLEELRREVAPRQVQREVFLREIAGQPKAHVAIMYLRDDPECFDVAQQIWRLLQDAKWDVASPIPIPASDTQSPTPMSVDGQPSGVTVVANSVSAQESEAPSNIMSGKPWTRTPWTVLSNALLQSMGGIKGWAGGPHRPPAGTLRVVVAPR